MNPNRLVRKIRLNLGLDGPLKDIVSDDKLMDIIDLKTKDTFSRYFKHVLIIKNIMFNDENRSHHNPDLYKLPERVIKTVDQMNISINGVKDIDEIGKSDGKQVIGDSMVHLPNRARDSSSMPFMGSHHVRAGYNQARNDILKSPIECEFKEPYFIHMNRDYYDISNTVYVLELFTDHPSNLSTIKDSYAEEFEELAELDVKIALWENYVSFLNDLDMGHSRVQLKKEKWENARDERKEKVKEYRTLALYDYPTVVVL